MSKGARSRDVRASKKPQEIKTPRRRFSAFLISVEAGLERGRSRRSQPKKTALNALGAAVFFAARRYF